MASSFSGALATQKRRSGGEPLATLCNSTGPESNTRPLAPTAMSFTTVNWDMNVFINFALQSGKKLLKKERTTMI